MNHYPHHIGDFDRATRHLTRLERSIYRDLLDVYYDTEKPITLDREAICRRIIARSTDEATAVELVLKEFFIETPDGWFHSRCDAEILHFRSNNSQKSLAGKASAAAKAKRKQDAINGCLTGVEQTFNGASTNQNQNQNHIKTTQPVFGEKFAMFAEWVPSPHVPDLAKQSMTEIKPDKLGEFIAHWLTEPNTLRTQAEWDKALLQSAKHDKLRADSVSQVKPTKFDPVAYVNNGGQQKPGDGHGRTIEH